MDAGSSGNGRGGNITISHFGEAGANTFLRTITITGALKANSQGSGVGGNVVIRGLGLSIAQAQFEAKGGLTGKGGLVRLEEVKLFGGGNPGITVSGNTKVTATGGTTSGNGGKAEIISETANVSINSPAVTPTVNVSPAGGNGSGGEIKVESGQKITIAGILNADAKGAGSAGKITITQTLSSTSIMVLDNALLSASGDFSGSGSGNEITITNSGSMTISMLSTVLQADASPNGNGSGGSIHVSSAAVVDLSPAFISATGGDSGPGGVVVATSVSGPNGGILVVNRFVTVDAGPNTAPSVFDGSISLNGVTCQQWKFTNDGSFPATYWNCVNPGAPSAHDQIPASVAQSIPNASTKTLLSNHGTQLFVFLNPHDESLFFVDEDIPSSTGVTFPIDYSTPTETAVFQGCTDCAGHAGSYTLTDPQLQEATAHEIGHAVDFSSFGEAVTATYVSYRNNDNLRLDYAQVDFASEPNSIRRNPCSPTPGFADPAPFVGVNALPAPNQPAIPMCVADPMNPGQLILNPALGAIPPGTRNSTILWNFSSGHSADPAELYAQTFAFVVANAFLDPAADGVFNNGVYFSCTVARARQLATGAGAIPGSCTNAIPTWYTIIPPGQ
ncbi:MAG TPA: hypothetical protein V6D17_03350 [Candidatus Obscuribacterales bacterium]